MFQGSIFFIEHLHASIYHIGRQHAQYPGLDILLTEHLSPFQETTGTEKVTMQLQSRENREFFSVILPDLLILNGKINATAVSSHCKLVTHL